MDDARLLAAIDSQDITDLIMRWGQARDRGDWDVLRGCFHGNGTIQIAWITGSGSEFVDKSAARLSESGKGEHAKHIMSAPNTSLKGARAFCHTHVNHCARVIVDGLEFDWEFWGQFFDLVERREDHIWRLFRRTMVYEKDRLDAVHGDAIPDGYFDADAFPGFPPEVRFLSWRLAKNGIPPSKNIITVNSAEEAALLAESKAWLDAG
jgi:hypothetical protein